ncbi:MAG: CHRD domain-containing protein, partial [Nitrososphaeraceae archaeon]
MSKNNNITSVLTITILIAVTITMVSAILKSHCICTKRANLLEGPMKGKQLSDLATTMSNGSTYVNVHTEKYPNGEIRGQIMMANSTSDKMMMMDK